MPAELIIGDLRTRITLLTPSVVTDPGGAQKPVYTTGDSVWAMVRPAAGMELIQAQAANVEAPITVTIRYRSDVTAAWGCRYNGVDYALSAEPFDPTGERKFLVFKAIATRGTL